MVMPVGLWLFQAMDLFPSPICRPPDLDDAMVTRAAFQQTTASTLRWLLPPRHGAGNAHSQAGDFIGFEEGAGPLGLDCLAQQPQTEGAQTAVLDWRHSRSTARLLHQLGLVPTTPRPSQGLNASSPGSVPVQVLPARTLASSQAAAGQLHAAQLEQAAAAPAAVQPDSTSLPAAASAAAAQQGSRDAGSSQVLRTAPGAGHPQTSSAAPEQLSMAPTTVAAWHASDGFAAFAAAAPPPVPAASQIAAGAPHPLVSLADVPALLLSDWPLPAGAGIAAAARTARGAGEAAALVDLTALGSVTASGAWPSNLQDEEGSPPAVNATVGATDDWSDDGSFMDFAEAAATASVNEAGPELDPETAAGDVVAAGGGDAGQRDPGGTAVTSPLEVLAWPDAGFMLSATLRL